MTAATFEANGDGRGCVMSAELLVGGGDEVRDTGVMCGCKSETPTAVLNSGSPSVV